MVDGNNKRVQNFIKKLQKGCIPDEHPSSDRSFMGNNEQNSKEPVVITFGFVDDDFFLPVVSGVRKINKKTLYDSEVADEKHPNRPMKEKMSRLQREAVSQRCRNMGMCLRGPRQLAAQLTGKGQSGLQDSKKHVETDKDSKKKKKKNHAMRYKDRTNSAEYEPFKDQLHRKPT